jgi:hypothetical protein
LKAFAAAGARLPAPIGQGKFDKRLSGAAMHLAVIPLICLESTAWLSSSVNTNVSESFSSRDELRHPGRDVRKRFAERFLPKAKRHIKRSPTLVNRALRLAGRAVNSSSGVWGGSRDFRSHALLCLHGGPPRQ